MFVRTTSFRALVIAGLLGFSGFSAWAASISGFAPDKGGAGTEVTVTGTGLATASFVYFGATEAPGEILARSANAVRVRVPANAFSGPISVFTTASGAASSIQIFIAAPRVTEFDPVTGDVGALVRISGVNFATSSGTGRGSVTQVWFQGQSARFQISGINQLLAVVPTNAVSGPITVANEAGSVTTLASFQVAAAISGFAPVSGRAGDEIEVRGRNLLDAQRVEFGGVSAAFRKHTVTNLFAIIPTNAIDGRVQVTTPAGVITTSSNFVVLPRVLTFTPQGGAVGTAVEIQGAGFHGLTEVSFNGVKATVGSSTAQRISVTVPNGATTGLITVKTANGTNVTESPFRLPARINSFTPPNGERGDVITLEGVNLAGSARVLFNGVPATFTEVSGTRLQATVPALATTGRITVENVGGTNSSGASFIVKPIIDGFQPASGPIGTVITLTGAGLTNITQARLGDVGVTATVVNSTHVRVIVPLNAFSGPLFLRTAAGDVQTTANFFVEGVQPTLTSLSPTNGTAGTKVTLTGTGLRTTSRVEFGGESAAYTVLSATQVEATVPPAAATGFVSVTTLDGLAVSTKPFVIGGPAAVALAVERSAGSLLVSWPASAATAVLEASPALGSAAAWAPVNGQAVSAGGRLTLTLPLPESGVRYFRLKQ